MDAQGDSFVPFESILAARKHISSVFEKTGKVPQAVILTDPTSLVQDIYIGLGKPQVIYRVPILHIGDESSGNS